MNLFNYRKLIVYQKSKVLVKRTYELLERFPSTENFALCNQLRRASISITSNIAEGVNRFSIKDKKHFVEIAYSSLMEVYCQLQLANDLNYITNSDFDQIKPLIEDNAKLLSGLRKNFIPKQ